LAVRLSCTSAPDLREEEDRQVAKDAKWKVRKKGVGGEEDKARRRGGHRSAVVTFQPSAVLAKVTVQRGFMP